MIEEGTNGEVDVENFYQNDLGGQQEVFDLFGPVAVGCRSFDSIYRNKADELWD